ncbi:DNA polymerase III subunit beta, partial [Escherichia coli K-12]|nr:DNA polymerase III subunit beta [Escherichia coli K-12]
LSIAQKAVSSKTSLPILEGILFKVYDQKLLLRSTNLEIGVQIIIPAEVETEGEIVLSANLISDLIRKLSGSDVYFESNDQYQIKIDCMMSNFTLKGLPSDEFPDFPEVIEDYSFSIDASELK